MKKLTAGPSQAMSTPPTPGPTTRATFPATELRAIAFHRSSLGTVLAIMACLTGWIRELSSPVMAVKTRAKAMPRLPVMTPRNTPMAKASTTAANTN